jgi:hypothetical protein
LRPLSEEGCWKQDVYEDFRSRCDPVCSFQLLSRRVKIVAAIILRKERYRHERRKSVRETRSNKLYILTLLLLFTSIYMAFTIGSLASHALCGACAVLLRHGNTATGNSSPTRARYARIRKAGTCKESAYRIVGKRRDRHRREVKLYKRVGDGSTGHLDGEPNELMATRRSSPRKKNNARTSEMRDDANRSSHERHKEKKSEGDSKGIFNNDQSVARRPGMSAPEDTSVNAASCRSNGSDTPGHSQVSASPELLHTAGIHSQHGRSTISLTHSPPHASGRNQSNRRKHKRRDSEDQSTSPRPNVLKTSTDHTTKPSSMFVEHDLVQQRIIRSTKVTRRGAAFPDESRDASDVGITEEDSAFQQPNMSTCQSRDLIFGTEGRETPREESIDNVPESQGPLNDDTDGLDDVEDGLTVSTR